MKNAMPWLLGLTPLGGDPQRVARVVAGQQVVVTGASRGIGREMALRLAAVGAHVVGVARTAVDLAALQAHIEARGGVFQSIAGDLRDLDWAEETGRAIVRAGAPVVLISNAGHSIRRPLPHYTDRFHDVSRTTGVNYLGAVAVGLPILAAMMAQGRGHLLSVTTTSVDLPMPDWSVYTASKGAYELWFQSVAPELRHAGVAATSVHLPRVATAMSAPTSGRAGIPELTIAQAADILCRALVRRPRYVVPWWSRAAAVIQGGFPGATQAAWEVLLKAGLRP